MEISKFSNFEKGIIFSFLCDAYSNNKELVQQYKSDWEEFDNFVFENLSLMDNNGFVSLNEDIPIGFMSWNPRQLPDFIEIGHNCIISEYKGLGKGKEQLSMGLEIIKKRNPRRIIAKTGNISFFLPARKMYESVGFEPKRIVKISNIIVPEIIEYELEL